MRADRGVALGTNSRAEPHGAETLSGGPVFRGHAAQGREAAAVDVVVPLCEFVSFVECRDAWIEAFCIGQYAIPAGCWGCKYGCEGRGGRRRCQ